MELKKEWFSKKKLLFALAAFAFTVAFAAIKPNVANAAVEKVEDDYKIGIYFLINGNVKASELNKKNIGTTNLIIITGNTTLELDENLTAGEINCDEIKGYTLKITGNKILKLTYGIALADTNSLSLNGNLQVLKPAGGRVGRFDVGYGMQNVGIVNSDGTHYTGNGVVIGKKSPAKFNSVTAPEVVKTGQKFNIKANMSGNTSGVKYKFVWSYNNWKSWGILRKEGTSNNTNVTMKKAGTYDIYVDVIHANGMVETKTKTIYVSDNGAVFTGITAPSTVKKGQKFNIKADMKGNTSGVKYKFVWSYNNWKSWGILRQIGASNNTNVTMKKAGTYDIYVDAIYPNGKVESKSKRVVVK